MAITVGQISGVIAAVGVVCTFIILLYEIQEETKKLTTNSTSHRPPHRRYRLCELAVQRAHRRNMVRPQTSSYKPFILNVFFSGPS
jgi:hypothetical protein